MHPGKILSDWARFIGLDRADVVPHNGVLLKRLDFIQRFLQVVFTEVKLLLLKCGQDR